MSAASPSPGVTAPPPTSPPAPPAASPPTAATSPPPSNSSSTTPAPPPPSSPAPASSPPPPSPSSTPAPASSSSTPPPPATASSPPPPPPGATPSPPSGATPSSSTPPPPSSGGVTPASPTSSSPPSSSNNISTAAVVGIAAGAVALLVFLSVLFVCCRRKKKRRDELPTEYYGAPPPRKEEAYAGQPQHWQHNVQPPSQNVVKIPPNLSPPPAYASRPPNPPPPPAPLINSSGASGSNYSDSESPLPLLSPGIALGFSQSTFTYEELVIATDGFSDANLLGQGGFGYVHRGMLPNGKEVAVKQLKAGSGQGEREFQAEVEIITRVHHRHLVSLVGYCINGDRRLLVYEFVPNNTLEFHLHGKGRPIMEWSTRLKIALGSAKGLAYLHEDCHPKIIHRDIKAANILLDYKFEAKVADFGLAKIASETNTHVSTRVMGTFGYLAPEYAASGKLTDKSDVFSFGVMLLELITGRRPVDSANTLMDDSLVDWARPLLSRTLEDGKYDALVDPRLQNNYNVNEMKRMVACAAVCVRHSARRRPRMSQIVRALEGEVSLDDLNDGVRPGHSSVYSYGSSDYDSSQYNEDMKKFRKLALSTQEYASTEYSAPTSEYGQNPSGSSSEGRQTGEMEMGRVKKNDNSRGFAGSS